MPTYRLLFFRGHQLDRWETLNAATPLEAVELAAQQQSEGPVELWSDTARIASFRRVGARH